MEEHINEILSKFHSVIEVLFGNMLVSVLLFGSYARGDFNFNSDIDIMILADIDSSDVSEYSSKVFDLAYDFEIKYGYEINPCVQSNIVFNQWKKVYPFFINIEREGVAI